MNIYEMIAHVIIIALIPVGVYLWFFQVRTGLGLIVTIADLIFALVIWTYQIKSFPKKQRSYLDDYKKRRFEPLISILKENNLYNKKSIKCLIECCDDIIGDSNVRTQLSTTAQILLSVSTITLVALFAWVERAEVEKMVVIMGVILISYFAFVIAKNVVFGSEKRVKKALKGDLGYLITLMED
ncbi:MAG: hypothetical protein FWG53_06010 [Clostridiales bacterium]|nr:hypothetical protein [Clostridiales bacterium]